MKSKLLQYLEPNLADKLIDYTDNQLVFDLEKIEKNIGYKRNLFLAKWLLIHHMIGYEDLKNPYTQYPFLKNNFLNQFPSDNTLWKHTIGNHFFPEFSKYFMPLFNIGSDGIGGSYHIIFCGLLHSSIHFSDHDNYPSDFQNVLSIDDLFKMQPIENLKEAVNLILTEKEIPLGINQSNNKLDFDADEFNEEVIEFMQRIEQTKPINLLHNNASSIVDSPFTEEKELSNLLTNKESDYYKYDNVRAYYNPLVAANFYWYYLTGQFDALLQLLDESKEIKGSLYQSIRATFIEISEGNLTNLNFTFNELNALRKGIEIPHSKLVDFEHKKFVKEIEILEQKKAKELARANDKYFKLNFFDQEWGISVFRKDTSIKKIVEDNSGLLEGFGIWEKPEQMIASFQPHSNASEKPNLPDRLYTLYGSLVGQGLIISEKVKNILEQYILPKHRFYPILLNSDNRQYPYFLFTQIRNPEDTDFIIDFSKSKFQLSKKIYQKGESSKTEIIEEHITFENYSSFFKTRKEAQLKSMESYDDKGNYFQLFYKFQNQEIHLNKPYDFFWYGTRFYVSNQLKRRLEESDLNLFITYSSIDEFPDNFPFISLISY